MTTHRPQASLVRRFALALPVLALLPLAAEAAEPRYDVPADAAGYGTREGSRRLDLSVGRSVVIDLPRDAKEVFVANPAVANAVVRSTRKIFLIGMANGATTVFVMDADGRQIASLEVNVGRDMNVLRQTLRTAIPSGRIEVRPAGDSILLTGTVASAGDAQQAVDIARAFVGQSAVAGQTGAPASAGPAAGGSNGSQAAGAVINALTIAGRDQVMIKVTVVEMARSVLKQFGVNVAGNWNIIETGAGAAKTIATYTNPTTGVISALTGAFGSVGSSGATINGQYGTNNAGVGGTLTALERAGVARVLAEPTLVAISGESANFLAGGEVPYPIYTCSGNGQGCTPTVQFKNVGVALGFTPIVLAEGRISLRVQTEVNELDRDNSITLNGGSVPGFRTRKTATTIELPSGASMVTAGLISSQNSQVISGVPGLINLPILGTLFRSRDFQRRDTELMILVTPFIAKPMESAQVVRPDDGFQDPTDPQTILLGRLNKLYGVAGPGGARPLSGRFGFITD